MACHLRAVGNKNNPPYTKFSDFCWNVNCPMPGNMVEFLQLTLQVMNCTLEIINQDVTADDTIEMISNGTADISLLALRQTLERMEKVDFTQPVNFLYYGYTLKEIPQLKVEDYILASFQLGALAMLIGTGIFVGALLYFYTRIFHYKEGTIFHWMILCCQAFLNQFSCSIRGPVAANVLIGFWLYFCMLIVSSYHAKLKSFLTLSHARGTLFTDLDGLIDAVNNKGYTMVIEYGGYTPFFFCKPEQCEKLRQMPKNKFVNLPKGVALEDVIANHNKWVGFSAWTYDITRASISFFDVRRKILFVRDTLSEPDLLAFAISKNNPKLREHFNVAVLMTYPGYPNTRARYMMEFDPYFSSSTVHKETTVLRLSHVNILFQTCGEILLFAILALLIEIFLFHFGSKSFLFVKENCCCSPFKRKLYIMKSLSDREFPRRQMIILPIRRSASPPSKDYQKFRLAPRYSVSQLSAIN